MKCDIKVTPWVATVGNGWKRNALSGINDADIAFILYLLASQEATRRNKIDLSASVWQRDTHVRISCICVASIERSFVLVQILIFIDYFEQLRMAIDSIVPDWFWFWLLPLLVVVVARALAAPSLGISGVLAYLSHHTVLSCGSRKEI